MGLITLLLFIYLFFFFFLFFHFDVTPKLLEVSSLVWSEFNTSTEHEYFNSKMPKLREVVRITNNSLDYSNY